MPNCKCGCGKKANIGGFLPGHDQKLRVSLEDEVGGLLALQELVQGAKKYSCGEAEAEQFESLVRRIFAAKHGR